MSNPVRLYVLHHPKSEPARALTNHIYDWFRLPSLDGIPVYVRSVAMPKERRAADVPADWPADWPLPPHGLYKPQPVLEYYLPLVDAQMVRDPVWHDYLARLAEACDDSERESQSGYQGVMLPVAMDATAFNLPRAIARRNFIRFDVEPSAASTAGAAHREPAIGETLKHLTEALARDLDRRVFPHEGSPAARFKIFISYARADGTGIAKTLRNYIQGETQCLAFLDENDIGYGQPFEESLHRHVGSADASTAGPTGKHPAPADRGQPVGRVARAMIVVNTDHYADRSWCRWEIDRFTTPRVARFQPVRSGDDPPTIHVFDPVLVVDALQGPRMTRVVPELAQAPMVRWEERRARLCFSGLMREVVLGLRDVRVAQQIFAEEADARDALIVNRLPGPVAIERLLQANSGASSRTIRYPGNGLSLIELRLLRKTFRDVRFRAFRDLLPQRPRGTASAEGALSRMRRLLDEIESGERTALPLRGRVLAVSTSYSEGDLAAVGVLSQHQNEALLHLLRPLLRLGGDLFYGGLPPKETAQANSGVSTSATRNITAALLRLVSEERPEDTEAGAKGKSARPRGSLLFNVCAWPRYAHIQPEDEAAWINSYRLLPFPPELAGLPPWPHPLPATEDAPPPGHQRYVAVVTSAIRGGFERGFDFQLPGEGRRTIRPDAFVFMGGRLDGFSGIMPGILEEFLRAAETGRPIYLFGGLGGATGVIARALRARANAARPEELTVAYYRRQPLTRPHEHYAALLKELRPSDPNPAREFDRLWRLLRKHRVAGLRTLFNNGLDDRENATLLATEDTAAAVRLVWKGISEVFLRPAVRAGGSRADRASPSV